jgi:SAM-dependent methyltransferase
VTLAFLMAKRSVMPIGCRMPQETCLQDETSLFREAWGLYDALAEMNYMFHREIYGQVEALLDEVRQRGPWSMLDLGCGNARFLSPCLSATPPLQYDGVDLSATALEEARLRFLRHLPSFSLHQRDMLEAVEAGLGRFDVIFSSFAVHHLGLEEKARLFRACSAALMPGGRLILVDVVREQGQTRDEYITGYLQVMRSQWTQVLPAELEAACGHVAAFDFPETLETLQELAEAASLPRMRVVSQHAQHHVLVFEP